MKVAKPGLRMLQSLLIVATLAGCATTGPFKEFADDVQQLRMGMTEAEVEAIFGPPRMQGYRDEQRCKGCWGWGYRRTSTWRAVYLSIFFTDGRVVDWEEWRPALNL